MMINQITVEKWHCYDISIMGKVNENPFDVIVTGDFRGPAGQQLTIPGFYNGDGEWLVRLAPTLEGIWSYKVHIDSKDIDDIEGEITCVPNRTANIHGKLSIHPDKPRYLKYEDGTDYFLLGYEADWLFALDLQSDDLDKTDKFLGDIAANGFNQIVIIDESADYR